MGYQPGLDPGATGTQLCRPSTTVSLERSGLEKGISLAAGHDTSPEEQLYIKTGRASFTATGSGSGSGSGRAPGGVRIKKGLS